MISAACYGFPPIYQINSTPEVIKTWLGIPITVVMLAIGVGAVVRAVSRGWGSSRPIVRQNGVSFEAFFWLFVPFSLAYGRCSFRERGWIFCTTGTFWGLWLL